MDPRPNQLSGTRQSIPNQLSVPIPVEIPADPLTHDDGTGIDAAPAAWQPPPPARPSRLRAFFSTLVGRLVIIGIIVVIGIAVRGYVSGNVGDLQVGDCFDPPSGTQTVKDVQHHPCTDSHGAEVFFVGTYAAAAGAPYPGHAAFEQYANDTCLPAFEVYTGSTFLAAESLDAGWFEPTTGGWTTGDRGVSCWLYRVDEAPMTQSYRGANP